MTASAEGLDLLSGLHKESYVNARRAVVAIIVAFLVLAAAMASLAYTVNQEFGVKDNRLATQSAVIAIAITDIEANCAQIERLGGHCPDYTAQLHRLDPLLGQ